jgi:CheY-like chemotaxis protein
MADEGFKNCAILLMEDDEDDAWLLQRALTRVGLTNFHVVRDGEDGLAYLTGCGKYSDRKRYPIPGFIITDLKMPLMSGLEVLQWLRADPDFRTLPTLVLTSSKAASDVATAYGFGANSYLVKPSSFDDLEKLGRLIRDYWERCELPPEPLPPAQ